MRKLFKWSFRIFILALLALAGLALSAWIYEDELKERAQSALNEGLLTTLHVKGFDYSVFRHFPKASLTFEDVTLLDGFNNIDTLLNAEALSFEIGIFSLLSGELAFDQIRASNGSLNLKRNRAGEENWLVWKTDSLENNEEQTAVFELKRVRLENIDFSFHDEERELDIVAKSIDADVKGAFQNNKLNLSGKVSSSKSTVVTEGNIWVHDAPVDGTLKIEIDSQEALYTFTEIDLSVAGVRILGDAAFATGEDEVHTMIDTRIKSIDLAQLKRVLPRGISQSLEPYQLKGKGEGKFTMSGFVGMGQVPEWSVQVVLRKASAMHREQGVELSGVESTVEVSGGGKSTGTVVVKNFLGYLEGGKLEFFGDIQDFKSPKARLQLIADLSLKDLKRFLRIEEIHSLDGQAIVEMKLDGFLPISVIDGKSQFDADKLRVASYQGSVVLNKVSLGIDALAKPLEDISGRVVLNGESASVEQLRLMVGNSDFALEGEISNILPWLLAEGEVLKVDARSRSRRLDLDSFLKTEEPGDSKEEQYRVVLPKDIDLRIDASFDDLTFRSFVASNLKGKIVLNGGGILFDGLQFDGAGGKYLMGLRATPTANGFKISANAELHSLNVQQLFIQFENFGQEFLTSSHLRGWCTASAIFQAEMTNELSIDPKSIYSSINLKLENGELIGLQSMQSISDYMRGNRLISPFVKADALEDKLRHISFATLENRIEIRDERIYFPMMDIHSSAMDIKMSGSHWFDNRIDYSVGLYLRDILVHKERTEFGVVENDGLGHRFFLSMEGTVDAPEFSYDRDTRREVRQEERAAEKNELKRILKEELNPFRKKTEDDKPTAEKGSDKEEKAPRWSIKKDKEKPAELYPPEDDDDF